MAAFKTFLRSEKLVGLSVAEVNPDHDPGLKMTKQLIEEVVSGLGGAKES
jgi:arginase family enzyme